MSVPGIPRAEATVVVMEAGSAWPAWIEQCGAPVGTRIVLHQDGPAAVLAERVVSRVESLLSRGVGVGFAVIACGERIDPSVRAARLVAMRSILSSMAKTGQPARLLLTAGRFGRSGAEREIARLATQLGAEWAGTGVSVSVWSGIETGCFQGPAAASGCSPRRRVASSAAASVGRSGPTGSAWPASAREKK